MKGTKLHELTAERLAELAAVKLPEPLPPDIRVSAPDPHNPTREQALNALRSVYRQLLSGKPLLNPRGIAARMVAPAILYLESQPKIPTLGGAISPVEWLRSMATAAHKTGAHARAREANEIADWIERHHGTENS